MDVEALAREIGFDLVAAIRADDVVTSRELAATCEQANLDYAFENGRVRFVGMILHSTT